MNIRRMKKVIVGFILSVILLASCGIVYLNNIYLPVMIKGHITSKEIYCGDTGELGNTFAFRITGTTQKPKYSILPMPLDLIKNIKDFFLGK